MRKGKCFGIIVVFVLAASLVVSLLGGACAPAAPTGEGDCSDVEAKLAAEKKKTDALEKETDALEKEIAALKKPAEVLEWEPTSYTSSGTTWEVVVFMADYITRMSDGRIVATPTLPGAVCPVAEQLDAIATGVTEIVLTWPGYFMGQLPICAIEGDTACLIDKASDVYQLYEYYEDGRVKELFREEYTRYGDVHLVGHTYKQNNAIMSSTVPIYGVDDLQGVKLRCTDLPAKAFAALGAGTVWLPVTEVYTALATGAIDAFWGMNTESNLASSMHEVTDYWIVKPAIPGPSCNGIIANGTVWKALPDDLKLIVEKSVDASGYWMNFTAQYRNSMAQTSAEVDYGIEMIEWSDEDVDTLRAMVYSFAEELRTDPAVDEYLNIAKRFMIERGLWAE